MSTRTVDIVVLPSQLTDSTFIRQRALEEAGLPDVVSTTATTVRRSIDARSRRVVYRLRVEVSTDGPRIQRPTVLNNIAPVTENNPTVIIVGAGPAGYFAALQAIELGIRPIVLDRGKDARSRRRDLRAIQQFGIVDPDSNYCFGEGGAGTYSDGKLYTRSHKRGSIEKVLRLLVDHGAPEDILIDAHPHIGSNRLWAVVTSLRDSILRLGGDVRFGQRVTDFILEDTRIRGVVVEDSATIHADAVILATGHSARDIFELCLRRNIDIEAKPFAVGVRIEHPQHIIDDVQYHGRRQVDDLPAASYSLVCQVGDRGVFSFCMCPGGLIVPSATSPGEIVVNGMSMSRRDSPFANSGTVTAVDDVDWAPWAKHGPLAGLRYQESIERRCFSVRDRDDQKAPAQRLMDFIDGRTSGDLPKSSYIPGLVSIPMADVLPGPVFERIREGVRTFGRTMKGYATNEAVVVATESRTSSPVRIPRDKMTLEHIRIRGLFPSGEGAGYAGGIVSAALDGQNVANAVATALRRP